MKEPFITTSHSKYHLHLSYNDIAEWARQIVELETTIKKLPYELRGFQTPSPEPVLQNKKYKRSTLQVQEPTQRSKPIHPPLKHSRSQTSLKSTIDLTETPLLSRKKHTRVQSSTRSPAVAARPFRSTKHPNSTLVPPVPTTATTATTTTTTTLFNSSPPPSLPTLCHPSSVEVVNSYFLWLQQKHSQKAASLNRILAILKQEGFIYKSIISKSNFSTILSILSLSGISQASGLLCIIQDEVQSYWRYQNTLNTEDTTSTNNLDEDLLEIEEEEVYENLYENDYDIDKMF